MITFQLILLILPIALGSPILERQTPGSSNSTSAPVPKVTIGGPDHPVEITGTFNSYANLDQYFNVPFAKPPIGDLRFSPPKPAEYGPTINGTSYGPACLQSTPDYAGAFGDLVGAYGQSEDCLQLNVFVPRDVIYIATGLPVVVFVPGGGFFGGSANSVDGSIWLGTATSINKPFIYVSIQYRVGVLGFPLEASFAEQGLTNLGLLDVKLALQWVQDNINSFGGDPTKVTVAGQSAGAALVGLTHLWPGENLYRSTILMSGSPALSIQNSTGLIDTLAKPAWDALLDSMGCDTASDVVECLRGVNATELLAIQTNLSTTYSPYSLYGRSSRPTVDGVHIPASPYQLLAEGKVRKVPFIIGNTKDEGTAFAPRTDLSEDRIRTYIAGQSLPPISDGTIDIILELYPDDPTVGAPFDTGNETFGLGSQWKRLSGLATDRLYTAPRRHFASSMTQSGVEGWSYRWDESEYPGIPPELGAFHGADIFFLAGLPLIPGTNYTDSQKALALDFITYVSNFIVFSDPNGPADAADCGPAQQLPHWPAYISGEIAYMKSSNLTIGTDDYRKEQIDSMNTDPEVVRGF